MIRQDGYYISEGTSWVDWHAGHKFEGVTYEILKFISNNKVLSPTSSSRVIDERIFIEREKKYVDEYKILDEHTIEIIFNPQSEWVIKKIFTVLSLEILLDENMKEYRFIQS